MITLSHNVLIEQGAYLLHVQVLVRGDSGSGVHAASQLAKGVQQLDQLQEVDVNSSISLETVLVRVNLRNVIDIKHFLTLITVEKGISLPGS